MDTVVIACNKSKRIDNNNSLGEKWSVATVWALDMAHKMAGVAMLVMMMRLNVDINNSHHKNTHKREQVSHGQEIRFRRLSRELLIRKSKHRLISGQVNQQITHYHQLSLKKIDHRRSTA